MVGRRHVTVVRHQLRITADLSRIAEIRAAVREVAAGCDAPEMCESDLVQAVDEAATNTIVHGYRGAAGWLEVTAEHVDDHIVITLEDAAPTFDPTTVAEPDMSLDPARRRPGGMGIHLIRLATDSMRHRPRPGGGNILTLTRRLDDEPVT
jgi:serine/threonine-protein kinase RsbW